MLRFQQKIVRTRHRIRCAAVRDPRIATEHDFDALRGFLDLPERDLQNFSIFVTLAQTMQRNQAGHEKIEVPAFHPLLENARIECADIFDNFVTRRNLFIDWL